MHPMHAPGQHRCSLARLDQGQASAAEIRRGDDQYRIVAIRRFCGNERAKDANGDNSQN